MHILLCTITKIALISLVFSKLVGLVKQNKKITRRCNVISNELKVEESLCNLKVVHISYIKITVNIIWQN